MGVNETIFPKSPQGTRMSKKAKNLMILACLMIASFVVFAIFYFSGSPAQQNNASENVKPEDLSSDQQKNTDTLNQLDIQANTTPVNGSKGVGAAQLAGPGVNAPPNMTIFGPGSAQGNQSPTNLSQSGRGINQGAIQGGGLFSGSNNQGNSRSQAIQQGMVSDLSFSGVGSSQDSSNNANNQSNQSPNLQNQTQNTPYPSSNSNDSYGNQNMQAQKNSFAQNAGTNSVDTLDNGVQTPVSPFMIMSGSIIPATLITGINSDLPGQLQAVVSQNVYDSRTGNNILIPQGSRLIGTYDSQIAYGQSRVLIVWTRVIFPNTQFIDLEGMPGADLSGYSGLKDKVDNHYFRIFGSALLMSVFSAGMQLSQPSSSNSNGQPTNQQILAAALGQNIGEVATQMTEKNMNIQPTIMIRPGDQFNVLVTKDIPFSGPYLEGNLPSVLLSKS